MTMLRMGKKTERDPSEILEEAISFFGPGGTGLEIQERSPNSVHFRGGGGHVLVQVSTTKEGSEIDVQTKEWNYDVKKFLQEV